MLQLPSDNWQQMAMNWYCHSHDHTSAAMATVGQQEMDCLVGSDYLVVHPSTVNNDSIHLVQVFSNYSILQYLKLTMITEVGI